jgi:SAM-dependent methyltransferase
VIRWLDRVVDAPADAPPPVDTKEAMQRVTRQAAFEPESWTPERAAKVGAMFDDMADEWDERQQQRASRYDALVDALARGGVGTGRCLEVGSGTGLATPYLRAHFEAVAGVDLSSKMLAHGSGPRVLADASRLPFAGASFDVAVLVNALLFPNELDRVLQPDGALLWVNTRGADTPIHLPPEDVAAAMPGAWTGTAAEAGLGNWTVLRRAH